MYLDAINARCFEESCRFAPAATELLDLPVFHLARRAERQPMEDPRGDAAGLGVDSDRGRRRRASEQRSA